MNATRETMLERFFARDRAWNGRFLTGVLTTGIYCLPSCPARKPRPENVRFFATEEEARTAGLRPCRRCRPELFYRDRDPELELALELAERIRREPGELADKGALARAAGVGMTKLNALFRRHFHDTPGGFLQRARVEAAQRLLCGTGKRVLDVALEAGFESPSAFHDGFRRHACTTPGEYRRLLAGTGFTLQLPADFRVDLTLATLGRDPRSPSERVEGSTFTKALPLQGKAAALAIELGSPGRADCTVAARGGLGAGGMAEAHRVSLRLLGLGQDPGPFERRLARRRGLARLIEGRRGLRIPQTASVWEGLVWTVVGQQVNLGFAFACRAALTELAGRRAPGGLVAHPTPAAVAALDHGDLLRRKYSRRKAEYLIDAARAIVAGELDLEGLRGDSAVRAERRLRAVRGLGVWSTQYILMRALERADCVPVGDSGLKAGLQRFFELAERPTPERTQALMEPFAPHRSLATFHLWKSLGEPV